MVKALNPNVSRWKPVSLAMSYLRSLIPINPSQSQVYTDPKNQGPSLVGHSHTFLFKLSTRDPGTRLNTVL